MIAVMTGATDRAFAPENVRTTSFLLFWGLVAAAFGVWRLLVHRERLALMRGLAP